MRERANCAERLVLAEVVDREAVVLAVAEEDLDQLGEVTGRDRHALESVVPQLAHDDVEDRAVADRHQRLREDGGVRAQAHALPACEDDGTIHSGPSIFGRTTGSP